MTTIPDRYKWYSRWTRWLASYEQDPLGAAQLSQPAVNFYNIGGDGSDVVVVMVVVVVNMITVMEAVAAPRHKGP